jgi:hypothetical protein
MHLGLAICKKPSLIIFKWNDYTCFSTSSQFALTATNQFRPATGSGKKPDPAKIKPRTQPKSAPSPVPVWTDAGIAALHSHTRLAKLIIPNSPVFQT